MNPKISRQENNISHNKKIIIIQLRNERNCLY